MHCTHMTNIKCSTVSVSRQIISTTTGYGTYVCFLYHNTILYCMYICVRSNCNKYKVWRLSPSKSSPGPAACKGARWRLNGNCCHYKHNTIADCAHNKTITVSPTNKPNPSSTSIEKVLLWCRHHRRRHHQRSPITLKSSCTQVSSFMYAPPHTHTRDVIAYAPLFLYIQRFLGTRFFFCFFIVFIPSPVFGFLFFDQRPDI